MVAALNRLPHTLREIGLPAIRKSRDLLVLPPLKPLSPPTTGIHGRYGLIFTNFSVKGQALGKAYKG